MKNYLITLLIIPLLFGCKKNNQVDEITTDFTIKDDFIPVYKPLELEIVIDHKVTTYQWDFGDGNFSKEKEPEHFYYSPGDYCIKLTVTDNQGKTKSISKCVSVGNCYVYEIEISHIDKFKDYENTILWDEENSGIEAQPDIFCEIEDVNDELLYRTKILKNVDLTSGSISFQVPEIKIHSVYYNANKENKYGIYIYDKDETMNESIMVNKLNKDFSMLRIEEVKYDNEKHIGEYEVHSFKNFPFDTHISHAAKGLFKVKYLVK